MDISSLIKSKALVLGFQKVGISSAAIPIKHKPYYDNWLSSGRNGTMQWLDTRKEERKDIYQYFPKVKSIVSVAINYYKGKSENVSLAKNNHLKFSNYAWGTDYHIIVKQKLNQLLEYIKKDLDQSINGLTCVDTSPLMEKQWAQNAGIGWQGKHTILLNEDYGSWFFLGELLLDIPLEYDQPIETDLCKTCTACIDACPTNAITEYQLDATKCISYLTTEYKDEFDLIQKDQVNRWIYGCDICQQACPWNKARQKYSEEEQFAPKKEIRFFSAKDWMRIDAQQFNKIFNNSPIGRIKHHRFNRNIDAVIKSQSID